MFKRKIIALSALLCLMSAVALADGYTTTLSATTDIKSIVTVNSDGDQTYPYKGCVNLYGTFNSATISWLVSTNDGTTKVALKDLSGTAVTSTAADNFCFSWPWPSKNSDQTIFYASVSGASSAPSLTIDLFDNR